MPVSAAEVTVEDRPDATRRALLGLPGVEAVAEHLEGASPSRIVAWATGWFGDGLLLAASFQDAVLIDLAVAVDPSIAVIFLDTGFHFEETLSYMEEVRRRYDLNLSVVTPDASASHWPCGSERCCEVRKVEPLGRVLAHRQAWMTGLRRVETPGRAGAPVVSLDPRHSVVKVNPLAAWSDRDVADYAAERQLPVHPLSEAGYTSIGCAPTTSAPLEGADPRSGRWPGRAKTECGLHV